LKNHSSFHHVTNWYLSPYMSPSEEHSDCPNHETTPTSPNTQFCNDMQNRERRLLLSQLTVYIPLVLLPVPLSLLTLHARKRLLRIPRWHSRGSKTRRRTARLHARSQHSVPMHGSQRGVRARRHRRHWSLSLSLSRLDTEDLISNLLRFDWGDL
jgi:hypothetical protein